MIMAKKKKAVLKRKKKISPKPKKTVKKKIVKKAKKKTGVGKAKKRGTGTIVTPEGTLQKIGEVTHYFPHVQAAAVKILKNSLSVGDEIYIKGHTTDFKEKIMSMQLDHAPIQEGKKGQEIGLSVALRVRRGDKVYKI